MIKAVFFDLNETLLNMDLLGKKFNKYFDNEYAMKYWFRKLLHSSVVVGSLNKYTSFSELARVELENLFYENSKEINENIKNDILGTFTDLRVYEDVIASLNVLKENKIKIIIISNSSKEMMNLQLKNSGIISLIDNYYSVDMVKKYKPFDLIYKDVINKEQLLLSEVFMIACHDWDLFGAKEIGLKTAYIKRKKEIFNPYYPKADLEDKDLYSLVKKIIKY